MACAAPCHPALTRSARAAELNAGKETRGRKGEVVAHEGRGGPVWAKEGMEDRLGRGYVVVDILELREIESR